MNPLRILPLASSFHDSARVRSTVDTVQASLQHQDIPCDVRWEGPFDLLMIVTGGTEHEALKALETHSGPIFLLAHPDQNSLPASLEILSALRQLGRKGQILLLNGHPSSIEALKTLAQAMEIREKLGQIRLGRMGQPSDWLVGSQPEPGLVKETWGPEVIDLPLDLLTESMKALEPKDLSFVQQDFCGQAERILEPSEEDLSMASRIVVALRRLASEHRLQALTLRCFDLVTELKTTGCLALSQLLDDGIVAGCEGDVPAALTMAWMTAMSQEPAFMANPQDLDFSDNTLWLAHCTIARGMLKRFSLRSHFESSLGVGIQGELEPAPCTLARIGGADLRQIFVSNGELLENGFSEARCRTQIRVRLEEPVEQLLRQPLGNHHVFIRGHWAQALKAYHELFIR